VFNIDHRFMMRCKNCWNTEVQRGGREGEGGGVRWTLGDGAMVCAPTSDFIGPWHPAHNGLVANVGQL